MASFFFLSWGVCFCPLSQTLFTQLGIFLEAAKYRQRMCFYVRLCTSFHVPSPACLSLLLLSLLLLFSAFVVRLVLTHGVPASLPFLNSLLGFTADLGFVAHLLHLVSVVSLLICLLLSDFCLSVGSVSTCVSGNCRDAVIALLLLLCLFFSCCCLVVVQACVVSNALVAIAHKHMQFSDLREVGLFQNWGCF